MAYLPVYLCTCALSTPAHMTAVFLNVIASQQDGASSNLIFNNISNISFLMTTMRRAPLPNDLRCEESKGSPEFYFIYFV